MRNHRRLTTTLRALIVSLVLALFVAACGEPGTDAAVEVDGPASDAPEAEDEPDVIEETTEEPPAEESSSEEAAPEGTADDPDGPQDAANDPVVSDANCSITSGSDAALGEDDYLDLVGPINADMEELVYEMEAALAALEDGTADEPTFQADLQALAQRWQALADDVDGATPPAGAEPWHERVLESWGSVCEAIDNGYHGSVADDSDRFDAFVDSLREFPSLVNDLHANAACGPFESC